MFSSHSRRARRARLNRSSEHDEAVTDRVKLQRLRTKHRMENDALEMPEMLFRKMFRLSRSAVSSLLDEMYEGNPTLLRTRDMTALSFKVRFLSVLNLLANGSYQKPTSENRWICQSQSTLSESLHMVLGELLKLMRKYVRFPSTQSEVSSAQNDFMDKLGMAGIVCAVDGTHIGVVQPRTNGHLYYNRKQFCSLNVLAACDADMRFLFVDAQFPGSVHESDIYQTSKLKQKITADGSTFMLGDSGFAASSIMLTPVLNPENGSIEDRYNTAHKLAHSVIERAFGLLKARWRCLHRHRILHYSPQTAARILYACMLLHNICVERRIDIDTESDDEDEDDADNASGEDGAGGRDEDDGDAETEEQHNSAGRETRNSYITRYYIEPV